MDYLIKHWEQVETISTNNKKDSDQKRNLYLYLTVISGIFIFFDCIAIINDDFPAEKTQLLIIWLFTFVLCLLLYRRSKRNEASTLSSVKDQNGNNISDKSETTPNKLFHEKLPNSDTQNQRALSQRSGWIVIDISKSKARYEYRNGYYNPYICKALFEGYLQSIKLDMNHIIHSVIDNEKDINLSFISGDSFSIKFGLEIGTPYTSYIELKSSSEDEKVIQSVSKIIREFLTIGFVPAENEFVQIKKKWTPVRYEYRYESDGWDERYSYYDVLNA